jgi:hypothetical protein
VTRRDDATVVAAVAQADRIFVRDVTHATSSWRIDGDDVGDAQPSAERARSRRTRVGRACHVFAQ